MQIVRRLAAVSVCCVVLAGALGADPAARKKSSGKAISNAGGAVPAADVDDDSGRELPPPRSHSMARIVEEELPAAPEPAATAAGFGLEQWLSPGGLGSTIPVMILMTVLSLVPSILIMTTCFVRFTIVLGLLRQALGTPQLPPNQVLTALCLFLTVMVMSPVWQQSYDEGLGPYMHPEEGQPALSLAVTFEKSVRPVRQFMINQIENSGNSDTVWMLIDYESESARSIGAAYREPEKYNDVSLPTLISSFLLSELKTAFVIGFQILLPFLVIDLVVATVLSSMGMMMLPPTLVSFPFKLLLFVLIDGWMLIVGMLLASVAATGAPP
ncbi:MAG: flagellar biosynthesis protein FliP [Planctomycetaceae bacterium]|nr:flagellar biosynthesis protein FliP [Planctomycetaceae bacterium]